MITLNESININGICELETAGKKEHVAYLNASINIDGNFSINRTIQNQTLFDENMQEVKKDFEAFDDYVYEKAQKYKIK